MFVIRSMTTTDFVIGSREPVRPYHIYLKPVGKRGGAWWATFYHAEKFATRELAEAEYRRSFPDRLADIDLAIAPLGEPNYPTYWAMQEERSAARRAAL
jgi:hypothetical protein